MRKDSASPLRRLLRFAKDSFDYLRFPSTHFRGVYDSFDQAQSAISVNRKSMSSRSRLASEYKRERGGLLESGDFPLIFFLTRTLKERGTVLDVGGNVGVHYLRCRKYLPQRVLRWIVWETAEIASAGREVCAGIPEVEFIEDVTQIGNTQIDFFFGCGCFQYADRPAHFLEALTARGIPWPPHVLIDQIPLYDGPEFVTVQNVRGLVHCPHYVFNRTDFEQGMRRLGYEDKDAWINQGIGCRVPFHRDRVVQDLSGYFFTRRS